MGEREAGRDPGGNRDRPVDPGRDNAFDSLGLGELADRGLVLGRDDRAPVCVFEAGRLRIAIAGDDEQAAVARGAQKPELSRAGS